LLCTRICAFLDCDCRTACSCVGYEATQLISDKNVSFQRKLIIYDTFLRPHHAAPRTAALAGGAGADRVQAGHPGRCTDVCTGRLCRNTSLRNSTSRLMSRPVSVSALHRRHRLSSDAPVFQPSAIELFRSPLPDCGTLCRRTSCRRRHSIFS